VSNPDGNSERFGRNFGAIPDIVWTKIARFLKLPDV